MRSFREYMEQLKDSDEQDIAKTLERLPPAHRDLLRNCKLRLQGGNTLSGDQDNIGYWDRKNDRICVAAPWHYGREFTFLHEIGHQVWENLPQRIQAAWVKAVRSEDQIRSPEETFCMVYANVYAKHKLQTFAMPHLERFVKRLEAL